MLFAWACPFPALGALIGIASVAPLAVFPPAAAGDDVEPWD